VDVSNPIRSVIPSVQGDVLAVLARTDVPLTGRGIAGLLEDVSRSGVQKALVALVDAGLVLVERYPPANLYRLNRRHLAAAAITELATLRSRLITAIRDHLSTWDPAPWGAWLFGSAARSDGTASSDIDLLIVRPDSIDETNHAWSEQVDRLADDVSAWTGNPCAIVEYRRSELDEALRRDDRLIRDIRSDGIDLTGRRMPLVAEATITP